MYYQNLSKPCLYKGNENDNIRFVSVPLTYISIFDDKIFFHVNVHF